MALVYRHRNPKILEVFYVGISKFENKNRAYNKTNRNKFWKRYVKKHGEPIVEIISKDLTWNEACELEIFLIQEYGRRDLKTGTLVNLTDGGEGNFGKDNGMYGNGHLKNGILNPMYGMSGKFCPSSKLVIDLSNGIFYESCKEASINTNFTKGHLRSMLNGRKINKTSFVYC